MDTYRTEDEQVAAIKGFIGNHGSKVLAVIILSIAIVLGVQGYMQKQSAHKSSASAQFNAMAAQLEQSEGVLSSDKQLMIDAAYQSLITDYNDTIYAVYANFLQAKLSVAASDLDAARGYLTWIVDNTSNSEMLALSTLRLGQLAFAQGDLDKALSIATAHTAPFERQYYSLEGDIYVSQGDRAKALVAYEKSKAAADSAQLAEDPIISLKIASLTPADDSKLVKPATSEESK